MKMKSNKKGITLIELLIALVISGVIVAAIYRMFVSQTRSYTVQDQVAEVQQNVRNAMELLVRDIRMAGFNDDKPVMVGGIPVYINPPDPPIVAGDNFISVYYEYNGGIRQVTYSLDGSNRLVRNGDSILENVQTLQFTYGIDAIVGGQRDRRLHWWVQSGAIGGANIVAVQVQLSARPATGNPDLAMVSPRSLNTAIAIRNQMR
jgi:prepilin-type N-terminal cleavage/methylation domain-containing protein